MQEELEIMRPMLEEAARDTTLTMDQIKVGGPSLHLGGRQQGLYMFVSHCMIASLDKCWVRTLLCQARRRARGRPASGR